MVQAQMNMFTVKVAKLVQASGLRPKLQISAQCSLDMKASS